MGTYTMFESSGYPDPPERVKTESFLGENICQLRYDIRQRPDGTWSCKIMQFDTGDEALSEEYADEHFDELFGEYYALCLPTKDRVDLMSGELSDGEDAICLLYERILEIEGRLRVLENDRAGLE